MTQHHFALGISYTGTRFHGWQYQNDTTPTIQASLERALSIVAAAPVRVTCAGRTDAGVHATQQVVNFSLHNMRSERAWVMGTNAHLPDAIAVNWARQVDATFSARFSATARRYCYLIYNHSVRSALAADMYTREPRPLDVALMYKAGQHLLGEYDFTSFRAANCQSNTARRNVHHLRVSRWGDMVMIDIQANAFLHRMVRNISGVLCAIGAGQRPVDWTLALLDARDRSAAGVTAPATGLYLIDVIYPRALFIAAGTLYAAFIPSYSATGCLGHPVFEPHFNSTFC